MKTLVIFVLSSIFFKNVTADSWLSSCRERRTLKTDDVVDLLEVTEKLDYFHTLLDVELGKGDSFRIYLGGTIAETVSGVRRKLLSMNGQFVSLNYIFATGYMNNYFQLVQRYANESENVEEATHFVHSQLRSRDILGPYYDQGFCVLTAFHDCGVDVDRVMELIFNCQSYTSGIEEPGPRMTLRSQLGAYDRLNACKDYLKLPEVKHVLATKEAVDKLSAKSLLDVKAGMIDFFDRFCSRWTPVVPEFLLSKRPAVDYRKHHSMFVRHIFENGMCRVHLVWINSWNCDMILDMLDYGYEKYEHSVTIEKEIRSEPPQMPDIDKSKTYSLGTLGDKFIGEFVFYKNAVQYDDIASTAMLFFAIREGGKILKGIRRVVKATCVRTTDEKSGKIGYRLRNDGASTVILDLRSTLSAFKSVFDHLVLVVLRKKRIDVSQNPHKKAFDRLVNSVVELLDVRGKRLDKNWPSIQDNMCTGVLISLDSSHYDAYYGDNAYKHYGFFEFYLTAPIFNINRLYQFYANDYM